MIKKLLSIFTISNVLSALRIPLALLFLSENMFVRVSVILFALATDCLDGYLARRYGKVSQLGAILDPITDRFFVIFASAVLLVESRLSVWELGAMISRDFFLMLFGVYLVVSRRLREVEFKAAWWGKVVTVVQFFVLLGLAIHVILPWYVYAAFVLLGGLACGEILAFTNKAKVPAKLPSQPSASSES